MQFLFWIAIPRSDDLRSNIVFWIWFTKVWNVSRLIMIQMSKLHDCIKSVILLHERILIMYIYRESVPSLYWLVFHPQQVSRLLFPIDQPVMKAMKGNQQIDFSVIGWILVEIWFTKTNITRKYTYLNFIHQFHSLDNANNLAFLYLIPHLRQQRNNRAIHYLNVNDILTHKHRKQFRW